MSHPSTDVPEGFRALGSLIAQPGYSVPAQTGGHRLGAVYE